MTLSLGRWNAFAIWSLASIFFAYQYVIRVLPNLIMPDVMDKFHMDASVFGQFSGIFYIAYAVAHIPVGILLDRIGPRLVLPVLILLTASGTLPLIYSDVWIYPIVGRILIGIGATGAILGVFKIVRMVYSEERFTLISGISINIGFIGAFFGGQPVNYSMTLFGWENVILALFVVGVILASLTYLAMPKQKLEPMNMQSIWDDVWTVISNPMVLSLCLLGGLMVGPLEGFAGVWATEYLKTVYDYSDNWGSTLPSFIFFGVGFGAPLLAYVASKTHSYYGMTILCGWGMALGFTLLLMGALDRTTMMFVFSIVGVLSAFQLLVIYLATTYVHEKVLGLTTACANMILMAFGYLFHSSIGELLTLFWSGSSTVNGVAIYDPYAYTMALSIIPVGCVLGTLGVSWLALRRKK